MAGKSFVAAAMGFFGKRPGTSTMDFSAELKALTYDDKLEIAGLLRKEPGFEDTSDPSPPVQK